MRFAGKVISFQMCATVHCIHNWLFARTTLSPPFQELSEAFGPAACATLSIICSRYNCWSSSIRRFFLCRFCLVGVRVFLPNELLFAFTVF